MTKTDEAERARLRYLHAILLDLVDDDCIGDSTWHAVSAAYFTAYGKGMYSRHMQNYAVDTGIVFT